MADSIYTARRPTHPRTARRPTHPHTARRPSMTYKARRPTTGGFIPWVAVESGDAVPGSPSSPARGGDDGGDERRGAWPAAEAPPPPFSFLLPSPSPPFSFFLLPSPLLHLPSLLYSPAPPLLHSGGSGAGGAAGAGHHRRVHVRRRSGARAEPATAEVGRGRRGARAGRRTTGRGGQTRARAGRGGGPAAPVVRGGRAAPGP